MSELMNLINVEVHQGSIKFPSYQDLKTQAEEVARIVSETEVTDDNIKESKKMIAAVNKSVAELEARRITIKKAILEPYNEFEKQIKEIVGIVKEADGIVRDQVRALEEIEREEKITLIEDIWNKRIEHYSFKGIFTFEDFLRPNHMNKTNTLKKIEAEMVEFLEAVKRDYEVINTMSDSYEILNEYTDCKDLAISIQIVNERKEKVKSIESKTETKKDPVTIFIVEDNKDAKLTEMLLKENKIRFTKEIK